MKQTSQSTKTDILVCIVVLIAILGYVYVLKFSNWEPSPEQLPWVGVFTGVYCICLAFYRISKVVLEPRFLLIHQSGEVTCT